MIRRRGEGVHGESRISISSSSILLDDLRVGVLFAPGESSEQNRLGHDGACDSVAGLVEVTTG